MALCCWQLLAWLSFMTPLKHRRRPTVHLATGPQMLPKPVLHMVRSSAASFSFPYPLVSLTSSSIWLRLLPRPPVTYILPSIFPSATCLKMQFLRKVWPIFRFPVTLVSLTSSSICLRLLPRLPVTSNLPCILPSITSFRRQFLRKMWPIQLAFLLLVVCRL